MLPKIEQPLFSLEMPSTGKKIEYRPMLVKEEKLLLMAKEGDSYPEKLKAIKQIVNNCVVSKSKDPYDIPVFDMTLFDIEYIFLKIRSVSVDNIIKISYVDEDDKKEREFEINLDNVTIDRSRERTNVIKIDKDSGFIMKYPSAALYDGIGEVETETDIVDVILCDSIDSYYNGEAKYPFKDEPPEKIKEFIDNNVSSKVYAEMRTYLDGIPSLFYEIKYKNNNKEEKVITFRTLNDFFIF